MPVTGKTFKSILTDTVQATGPVEQSRFVNVLGAQAGAGEETGGVSQVPADPGDFFPVDRFGVLLVESGGPVTAGVRVQSDADACAVMQPEEGAGAPAGLALDDAAAAGVIIRIRYPV